MLSKLTHAGLEELLSELKLELLKSLLLKLLPELMLLELNPEFTDEER